MIAIAAVPALLAAAPLGGASVVAGEATAFSGGQLTIGHRRIRLHGIAAPRIMQHCYGQAEADYPCGRDAQAALATLVEGRIVRCTLSTDTSAICHVGSRDLAAELLRLGYAVPTLRNPPVHYRRLSIRAQAERRGMWRGRFIHPDEWDEAIRRTPFVAPSPKPTSDR